MQIKLCSSCEEEISPYRKDGNLLGKLQYQNRSTCSRICQYKLQAIRQKGNAFFKGHKQSKSARKKISDANLLAVSEGRRKTKHTKETRLKMSLSAKKGSDSLLWKGGKTEVLDSVRNSSKYKIWRESVFERDDYTCQDCGVKGGRLQADHIKPFSLYPEFWFDIDNGKTLCVECHKKTNTFGAKVFSRKCECGCGYEDLVFLVDSRGNVVKK